jgi:hypothetical protein
MDRPDDPILKSRLDEQGRDFDLVVAPVQGRDDLIANKRATDRPQDRADVAALERSSPLRQEAEGPRGHA